MIELLMGLLHRVFSLAFISIILVINWGSGSRVRGVGDCSYVQVLVILIIFFNLHASQD